MDSNLKYIFVLVVAAILCGCDMSANIEQTTWDPTLAIDSDGRTEWRVVFIGSESENNAVVEIPDYAREVLIIKDSGTGFVRAHLSPDNRDFLLPANQDTLRIRMK